MSIAVAPSAFSPFRSLPNTIPLATVVPAPIEYPDSDGQPMADNTKQWEWMVSIKNGFEALYQDDANVFVAGDLLWYAQQGKPEIRLAPDVMLAFGRPKGYRGSYKQWQENDIAPQVVFEILSPGNRPTEMRNKLRFYNRYEVEEYYVYDPDTGDLEGYVRQDNLLQSLQIIQNMQGYISPRTQVKFNIKGVDLMLTKPDGSRFESYLELLNRANTESSRANAESSRAERLAAQLRALGITPEI